MPDDFSVDVSPYEGIDVQKIASEELFKHSLKARDAWVDNLRAGKGASGSHGEHRESGPSPAPYNNTGETQNDVTVEPQQEGSLEYTVGGDVVQLAVAEFGRRPGAAPPPREPIARWADEKGLAPEADQTFDEMVDAIRFAIADRGLHGFAPGRAAAREHDGDALAERVDRRFGQELENQSTE